MRKLGTAMLIVTALLFGSFAMISTAAAAAVEDPVLITSAGQSPGALMVRVLADQAGVTNVFDATVGADGLAYAKSFIVVIGASMKGLGAAGLDVEDEFARIESLLETAKEMNIPVIAMHVEGGPRRGTTSDELSRLVFPYAEYAIVRADGNDDGFFTDLADEYGVTLETVEKTVDAAGVLRTLYGG